MTHSTTLPTRSLITDLAPITATIDLAALAHNLSHIRRCVRAGCEILAVVKADAYGHGSGPIARSLMDLGIRQFGVSTVEEGCALRAHGITQPILVMGGLLPSQIPELLHHQLTPVVSNEETVYRLMELVEPDVAPYPVHIKIDTGMRRLGFPPDSVCAFLNSHPFEHILHVKGLMTHLADADNSIQDFTREQLRQFQDVITQLKQAGHSLITSHAANSSGIRYHPTSHFDMVRPGLMLYGCSTGMTQPPALPLQPVMKVATSVVHTRAVAAGDAVGYGGGFRTTRPSQIAILPVGYAHGYSRSLSNKGIVLLRGQRVPVIGKICMDMMLIDVTGLSHVRLGEEVVLLGPQEREEITAEEIATWLDTIPYEVLCSLGSKAHHIYESGRKTPGTRDLNV